MTPTRPAQGPQRRFAPGSAGRRTAGPDARLRRLCLEPLEDRRLLSVGVLPMPPGALASLPQWGNDDFVAGQAAPTGQNVEAPPEQVESLLLNGGFETGDFTGWTARPSGLSELTPWTVSTAGGGFFFNSSPYDGDYSALNGFDGAAGLQYELFQDVAIPADRTRVLLSTHHRIVYTADGTGAQDRTLTISVRDTAGELLETLYTEAISPAAAGESDLGWQAQVFDVSAYAGQTVRIHFEETIPDAYTGPAMVELDDIRLEAVLGIDVGPMATDLVEGASSTVDVRLSSPITSDVTVSVARTSGDEDITVSPGTLVFTSENWWQAQPVVFTAAEDGDSLADRAEFNFMAEGLSEEVLGVVAIDDDNMVNTLADAVAVDGLISLREALEAANTNTAVNEAPAGSATELDFIHFDMAALQAEAGASNVPTITLNGTQLSITDDVVVAGPGTDQLVIDAAHQSRVVYVGDGSEDSVIDVAMSGLTVAGGFAGGDEYGGGIHNDREALTLNGIAVRSSTAENGGGIYSYYGTLSVTNSTLSSNRASYGGGIYSTDTLTVANSTLSGNYATRDGGGLYGVGTLSVTNSTLSSNTADYGGGIYSTDTLTVANSTLSDNLALDNGGGIYGRGTLSVAHSTLSGNTAWDNGGGIWNSDGTLSVTNSTLSGNSSRLDGGGITSREGPLSVTNSTLAGNSAGLGGAIHSSGDHASINNSILWQNGGTQIHSLGALSGTSNLIGVDPAFVRDPSDGGDGWGDDPATHDVDESANDDYGDLRLTDRSIAVDQGDLSAVPLDTEDLDLDGVTNEPIPFDLDGNSRIFGGSVDCGAYEYQHAVAGRETPSAVVTTSVDIWDLYDGQTSLREAICYAGAADLGTTITFDAVLNGAVITLANGPLAVSKPLTIDASSLTSLTVDADGRSRVFNVFAEDVVLDSLTITGGVADRGAGVYNWGALSVTNSTLSGNSASVDGGGIYSAGSLSVSNSTLSANSASDDGGGIYSYYGTLSVSNSTLSANSASDYGGGICGDDGTLSVTNSTLSGNSARSCGGGISTSSTAFVTNSTLAGNSAGDHGGGIHNSYILSVINSVLSGNSASDRGGGISDYGILSLTNSTLSGNAGGEGDGVFTFGVDTNISNSILWQNGDTAIEGSYFGALNLIDVEPSFVRNPSDGGDGWRDDPATPGVDESANDDYGDLRPQLGSVAIDAGDNASLPLDEFDLDGDLIVDEPLPSDLDGKPRIVGGTVDIGAYEYFIPAAVAGRHLFYNNSHFDGNEPAAGASDDAAIVPDKQPLLPGDIAGFANYTSYSRGINGLMVDIDGLKGIPMPSDFDLRIGNDNQPAVWQTAPPPASVTVRHGAGVDGSDRVTLIWPDGAIHNTWLQVIVKATPNTGLAAAEVFCYGNAVGEVGNSTEDAMVTSADEIAARHHPQIFTPAAIDNPHDFDRDGRVSSVDQIIARRSIAVFDAPQLIDFSGESLLVNGGFETGDFTGWTARTNGRSELTPWAVSPAEGGFFFNSSPYEGDYSALNGFDGAAGLQYELFQDVAVPAERTRVLLTTHHRIVYAADGTGTQDRTLAISVRDTAGELLETLYTEAIPPEATGETDLGWQEQVFNLTAYGGQTVRIHFEQTIPDAYTGPSMIELDDIRLQTVLAVDVGSMTPELVEGSSSTVDVRLSSPVTSNVTVSVARTSGDEDITVSPATLLFTRDNWDQAQPVVFSAAEDPGLLPDVAEFTFAAEGLPEEVLEVVALDNESFVVDTLQDVVAVDGLVSLREALQATNTNAAVNEAPAGSFRQADSIRFDMAALQAEAGPGNVPTITLGGTQLSITDDLIVTGPGADQLIIDAAALSRVIYVGDGFEETTIDVAISGLTVTGGAVGDETCGGGIHNDQETVALNDVAVLTNTAHDGGGIFSIGGTLSIINSTLSGNSARDDGSGIYSYGGTLSVTNSTLSGNSAVDNGGGIYSNDGNLSVTNSTLSGNSAADGGGIYSYHSTFSVTNSTLSGNSATTWGGGIYAKGHTLLVTNSTLAGNVASSGSAIHVSEGSNTLSSSILWQNGGTEIGGFGEISGTSNLINVDPAFVRDPSDGGDGWGDDPATPGVDESANDDYGDLHLTDRSIAVDYGDLSTVPPDTEDLDEDGLTDEPIPFDLDGNPRVLGGSVDCGAYEYQGAIAGREAPSVVVTTAADVWDLYDDQTSLREAIYYAGMAGLGTTITFDPTLDGAVITLNSRALAVTKPLTIDASALTSLTVDADGRSRVLLVLADDVVLDSLTITGGLAEQGGGIYSTGTLSVANSTLSANSASDRGGGICSTNMLSVSNSTLADNSATYYGGGICSFYGTVSVTNSTLSGNSASHTGGGVYSHYGTLSVRNSTLSDNSATYRGGGIWNNLGTLSVTNSTLSSNTASDGGGIYSNGGTFSLTNSTLSRNSAGRGGGLYTHGGTLSVTNSTLLGNSAGRGGGIQCQECTFSVVNSTLSGNSASDKGGGIYIIPGTFNADKLLISNSILWQNAGTDIEGPYSGTSNLIGVDPSFVRNPSDGGDGWGDDPATTGVDESANDDYGDLRLQSGSPAVDAGDNAALPLDELDLDGDGFVDEPLPIDLDGNPRIIGGTVDIGAYEYFVAPVVPAQHDPQIFTPAAVDQIIARQNIAVFDTLELIDLSTPPQPAAAPTATSAQLDWLFDFEQLLAETESPDDEQPAEEAVDAVLATMLK